MISASFVSFVSPASSVSINQSCDVHRTQTGEGGRERGRGREMQWSIGRKGEEDTGFILFNIQYEPL